MVLTSRLFISVVLLSMLIGCSSVAKLGPLPVEKSDYLLSKQDLLNKFPEIEKYEYQWKTRYNYVFLAPVLNKTLEPPDNSSLPRKNEVLAVFGRPYGIKASYIPHAVFAGILIASGIDPVTAIVAIPFIGDSTYYRRYFFEKGNYCVETTFTRTFKTKYRSLMKGWQWHEESCKNVIKSNPLK